MAEGLGQLLFGGSNPSHPEPRTTIELTDYVPYVGKYELQEPYKGRRYLLRISDTKINDKLRLT
jgi:hypothetical protein